MQTMFSEPHSGQVSFPVTVRGMRSSPQSLQPCTLGESCISFGFTSFVARLTLPCGLWMINSWKRVVSSLIIPWGVAI